MLCAKIGKTYQIKYILILLMNFSFCIFRYIVLAKDFEKGYKNNIKKDETEHEFYK